MKAAREVTPGLIERRTVNQIAWCEEGSKGGYSWADRKENSEPDSMV